MKLKMNIQLFADDENMADNDVETTEEVESTDSVDADTEEETPVDKTKAFSQRLKAKTEEIEKSYQDKLNSVAKQQGFDSWEELEAAADKQAMEDLGVEDEEKFQNLVNRAIEKNPDVIKAREIVRKSEEDNHKRELDEQVELINKIDGSIKSMDDIAKLENVQEIIDKVKKGYTLYDAYRTSNMDKILSNNLDSARRNAIDDINSKSHIKTSTGGTGKTIHVPKDVYDMYKRNLPSWTDDQIRKHYAKDMEG